MRNTEAGIESEAMHHRKITLPDGRYMIFYTFGEEMEKNGAARETEQHLTSTSVSSPSQPEEE